MILISSINGKLGLPAAMEVMKKGGSAVDAVEAGTRLVELNTSDHSVGLGGLPNVLGEVRLDAAIMDGESLRSGAVGSVRNHIHVISLARKVMEESPHVLLVGDGAERFAREMTEESSDLLTTEAKTRWQEGLSKRFPEIDSSKIGEHSDLTGLVRGLNEPMAGWEPEEAHGTVNFLAQDRDGNVASAVSTSGWPWGYPGRLGDSPVVCAGSYADNRWGAAASTGTGEVVLRTAGSRSIILYMKMGMDLEGAVREALRDLGDLDDPYVDHIAMIAIDRAGNHAGYAHRKNDRYAVMSADMDVPEEVVMAPPE
jgi:beta-aspartyl-peptidase (threonine type)